MQRLIRLRELPGIQRASELCRLGYLFDYPHVSTTMEEINRISVCLFSVTAADTLVDDDDTFTSDEGEEPLTPESYENMFSAALAPWDDRTKSFWEAISWDISDGKGNELNCTHLFARQIIAVTGNLIDGIRFTPDGTGRWYMDDVDDPEEVVQGLTERLQREVAAFLIKRNSDERKH